MGREAAITKAINMVININYLLKFDLKNDLKYIKYDDELCETIYGITMINLSQINLKFLRYKIGNITYIENDKTCNNNEFIENLIKFKDMSPKELIKINRFNVYYKVLTFLNDEYKNRIYYLNHDYRHQKIKNHEQIEIFDSLTPHKPIFSMILNFDKYKTNYKQLSLYFLYWIMKIKEIYEKYEYFHIDNNEYGFIFTFINEIYEDNDIQQFLTYPDLMWTAINIKSARRSVEKLYNSLKFVNIGILNAFENEIENCFIESFEGHYPKHDYDEIINCYNYNYNFNYCCMLYHFIKYAFIYVLSELKFILIEEYNEARQEVCEMSTQNEMIFAEPLIDSFNLVNETFNDEFEICEFEEIKIDDDYI